MQTTPDDNATTWRDLADQLTPKQIAELEYCERKQIPPGVFSPQGQLNCARAMARENIIQALCADIPAPTGAVGPVYTWEEWQGGGFGRLYVESTCTVGDMSASIMGVQHDDGRIERFILPEDLDSLTGARARQFAALLIKAADELDRLQ